LDSDVHFIWALSKDFGSSGFRFGLLYSQNEALSKALANINMFSSISHPMQLLIKDVIEDYEFMDEFLNFSRKALAANLETCTKTLDELHLPYVDTNAGIFVYVDFSSLLPINPTPDDEHRLAAIFETCARIVMTPGHAQRDRRPGHFRICYAWVSIQVLSIAMRRIKLVVSAIRGMGIKKFHEQSLGELTQSDKFVNVVHEAI
jgi:aspartate/methionine/tyrosine aminotransferase